MKIAIISDLHWGVRNNSSFFATRMEEFYNETFFPYLQENGINTVWILGDLYENRKQYGIEILNRVHSFFEEFKKRNIEVYCLIGNHDIMYKNTNSITSLIPVTRGFSNFHIIKEFEVIKFDGLPVGFISWINPSNKDRCLNWVRSVNASVLCGHFEINDFEIINKVICTTGLDSNLFDRFTRVFSGHFHIKAKKGNIQYVGNPYQTNWGEYGYEKGFHVYDTHNNGLEFIRNPVDIYQVLCYNDSLVLKDVNINFFKNKIVRILAESGKSSKKQKMELLIEMIGVVAQSVELIEDKDFGKPNIDDEAIQTTDTAQLINSYLESSQVLNVDKKLLQDLVFGIYREALERGTILI